jgi:Protein of unknown function (DUF3341)
MSRRVVVGVFDDEEKLLGVTRQARAEGLKVIDVFTPYAVHGLDAAMGLRASRLPWVCFFAAITGAALKLWFEFWTTMVDWPVNVGGKPWNSLPAFVPITFEVMVLSAGLATVFVFLVLARLRPGKRVAMVYPGVTDDKFVLVLEESDARFDLRRVQRLFEKFGALAVEERLEEA